MTLNTRTKTKNDKEITVYVDGPQSAQQVLLATGFIGVAGFWSPVIEHLKKNFQVISYDQRGTGQSDAYDAPLTMEQLADDALAVLDSVCSHPTIVLGHSMGACVGWILADRAPESVSAVYALGGWDRADAWMRRVFEARLTAYSDVGPLAYVRATTLFMNPPQIVNANEGDITEAENALVNEVPPFHEIDDRAQAVLSFDAHRYRPKTNIPMRIACAVDDWMTPVSLSENLNNMHPTASFKSFDIGGHYMPKTRAHDLASDFADWNIRN